MSIENNLERIADSLAFISRTLADMVGSRSLQSAVPPLPVSAAMPAPLPELPGTPVVPETGKAKRAAKPKAAAPEATATPVAIPQPIARKTVHDTIMAIANTVNRQAAIDLMAKFGAQLASELKTEDFEAVLKAASEVFDKHAAEQASKPAAKPATDSLI